MTKEETKEATLLDGDVAKEVRTRVKLELLRSLQIERCADECKAEDGRIVFAGMDFSMGNDLGVLRRWSDGGI